MYFVDKKGIWYSLVIAFVKKLTFHIVIFNFAFFNPTN